MSWVQELQARAAGDPMSTGFQLKGQQQGPFYLFPARKPAGSRCRRTTNQNKPLGRRSWERAAWNQCLSDRVAAPVSLSPAWLHNRRAAVKSVCVCAQYVRMHLKGSLCIVRPRNIEKSLMASLGHKPKVWNL